MKVYILVTEEFDETERLGTITLADGKLIAKGANAEATQLMQKFLHEKLDLYPLKARGVYKGTKDFVTADMDPELYLQAMPYQYHGGRVTAEPDWPLPPDPEE